MRVQLIIFLVGVIVGCIVEFYWMFLRGKIKND